MSDNKPNIPLRNNVSSSASSSAGGSNAAVLEKLDQLCQIGIQQLQCLTQIKEALECPVTTICGNTLRDCNGDALNLICH